MPLATRSLGRLLLPVVLGLSPVAASAASEVTILRDEWAALPRPKSWERDPPI